MFCTTLTSNRIERLEDAANASLQAAYFSIQVPARPHRAIGIGVLPPAMPIAAGLPGA